MKWGGVTGLGVLVLWDLVHVFLSLDSSICEMGIQAPLSSGEIEDLKGAGARKGCRQSPANVGVSLCPLQHQLPALPGLSYGFRKFRYAGCHLCLLKPRNLEIGFLFPAFLVLFWQL